MANPVQPGTRTRIVAWIKSRRPCQSMRRHLPSSLSSSLLRNIFLGFPFSFNVLYPLHHFLVVIIGMRRRKKVRPDVKSMSHDRKRERRNYLLAVTGMFYVRKKMECKLEVVVIDFHRQTQ